MGTTSGVEEVIEVEAVAGVVIDVDVVAVTAPSLAAAAGPAEVAPVRAEKSAQNSGLAATPVAPATAGPPATPE